MATDLDGGDAEAAGLEHGADAAGRHALAEAAHHPSAHHHVLHGDSWLCHSQPEAGKELESPWLCSWASAGRLNILEWE